MKRHSSVQSKVSSKQKIALLLFGLFLFFVLLEVTLRLGGLILLSIQEQRNLQSIKQKGAYRIMCLGESTTSKQYPLFLGEFLNRHNSGIQFSVVDKGIGGIDTFGMLEQFESNLNEYHPNMVVAMIGINDGENYNLYSGATLPTAMRFVSSLRICSLAKLLWLHISAKAKEMNLYKPVLNMGSLKKALELNYKPYIVGWLLENQDHISQVEDSFRKAIETSSKNDETYLELGRFYLYQCKFSQAEDAFKKALEINPKNDRVHLELGQFYQNHGNLFQAEDTFKKASEINPKNDRVHLELGQVHQNQGDLSETSEKANAERLEYCNLVTANNYRKLKEILDKNGIKLICVQYPMRNVKPLEKIFEQDVGIIFVDNESVFKEALKKADYKEYFRDTLGGDFGHCTDKGNKLLAQNIANVILKEVFNK